jgi:hypothetical protein
MSVETNCYHVVAMPHRVEEEPNQGGPDQQYEQGELDELLEFIKEQYESPGLAAYLNGSLVKQGCCRVLKKQLFCLPWKTQTLLVERSNNSATKRQAPS